MKDTKRIVQAGLFVSIYAIFFLISRYVGGFLEEFCFFLLPLPLIIFTNLYGFKYALIPYICIGIIGFFINPLSTIFYVLTGNILGIVYGEMIRKKIKGSYRFIMSVFVSFIVNLLTMVVFASLFGYSISIELKTFFSYILKLLHINNLSSFVENNLIYVAASILIVLMSLLEAIIIDMFAMRILKRLKMIDKLDLPLFRYRLPKWSIIIGLVSIILHLSTIYYVFNDVNNFLTILGVILMIGFYVVMLIFGIESIVHFYIYSIIHNYLMLFSILIIVGLLLLTVPFIIILGLIGIIIVYSDKQKTLLYNKNDLRSDKNV